MKSISILIVIIFSSCISTVNIPFERSGMVECIEKDRTTITLSSTALANEKNAGHEYAIRNAFENLLFKGIPNSNQEKPLIGNESKSRQEHEAFYYSLFQDKEYRKFIIDNYIKKSYKSKSGVNVNSVIKVDLQSFKNHLEQEKVTRKFGL